MTSSDKKKKKKKKIGVHGTLLSKSTSVAIIVLFCFVFLPRLKPNVGKELSWALYRRLPFGLSLSKKMKQNKTIMATLVDLDSQVPCTPIFFFFFFFFFLQVAATTSGFVHSGLCVCVYVLKEQDRFRLQNLERLPRKRGGHYNNLRYLTTVKSRELKIADFYIC